MIKKIYIAGPLFNKHEQMYLEDIAKENPNEIEKELTKILKKYLF